MPLEQFYIRRCILLSSLEVPNSPISANARVNVRRFPNVIWHHFWQTSFYAISAKVSDPGSYELESGQNKKFRFGVNYRRLNISHWSANKQKTIIVHTFCATHAIWLIKLSLHFVPTNIFIKFGENWIKTVWVRAETKVCKVLMKKIEDPEINTKSIFLRISRAIAPKCLVGFSWLSNLASILCQQTFS